MLGDEQIAGLIVFPLAFIGVLANWTVALLIRKLPSLKNSFGRLTASQSIGDAIHSTVFAFLFSPMCIFGVEFMKTYSSVIGHILLIAYDISTYSHLCISLNRFCSIVAPIKYDTIFSMSNTKKLIMFSWACAVLPFFISTSTLSKTTSQSHAKKRSAEMNFLKQACLQAFVFVCELITYFLITPRVEGSERWLRFFLSTVAWVCVHMLDGIITLSFNKEFTQTIFRGIKIKDLSGYTTHHHETTSNAGSKH